jgi:hypothetical protein
MASQGDDLATRFEQANAEFVRVISTLTPEQWSKQCPGEGRTVGVVANHVAEDHGVLAGLILGVAQGGEFPLITPEALNQINAEHAVRAANVSRDDTVTLARDEAAKAIAMLRGLSDEQLARSSILSAVGGAMSCAQVAENILIGHIGMHLSTIQQGASS